MKWNRTKLSILAAVTGVVLGWACPGEPHTPLLDMWADHLKRKAARVR